MSVIMHTYIHYNTHINYFSILYIYRYIYIIYTVGTESIQTPLNFSLFVNCSHLLNHLSLIFFPH